MRLKFCSLLGSLLILYITNVDSHRTHAGCNFVVYGERMLRTGVKLRENLINILAYLETRKTRNLPPEIFNHFGVLKSQLKSNIIDVFQLIPHLRRIYDAEDPAGRMFKILDVLDRSNREGCDLSCSLKNWQKNRDLNDLFGQVPQTLIFEGLSIRAEDDRKYLETIGSKLVRKKEPIGRREKEIYATFGPSILKILLDLERSSSCFSENFFGYLLPFYPWQDGDAAVVVARDRLQRYFTSKTADFLDCKIFLKDLRQMIGHPMMLLDYILKQMVSTQCEEELVFYVDTLLSSRKIQLPNRDLNIINPNNFTSMINLLDVITSESYPIEVVLARDRVYNYLFKVLPFIDKKDFKPYFYNTAEERLLGFLNFISQRRPFPIPEIKYSIDAIIGHLLLRTGPHRLSSHLLLTILNSWLAPDLLVEIRQAVMQLRKFVMIDMQAVDSVLSPHGVRYCFGMISCYTKMHYIILNSRLKSRLPNVQLPPCLVENTNCYYTNNTFQGKPSDFLELIKTIDYYRYPSQVVQHAQNLLEYVKNSGIRVSATLKVSACTNEELLLSMLQSLYDRGIRRENVKIIIDSILDKIRDFQVQVKFPVVSPIMAISGGKMTTLLLLETISEIQNINEDVDELEAAKLYVKENEDAVDQILMNVDCRRTKYVLECFQLILDQLKAKPRPELNCNIVGFLVKPTVCDQRRCWWLPYEELESGPLNPLLDYLVYLVQKLHSRTKNFHVKMDLNELLMLITTENLRLVLEKYVFQPGVSDKKKILQLLQLLQIVPGLSSSTTISINNLIRYLTRGEIPKVLSVNTLVHIQKILSTMTDDTQVVLTLEEKAQLVQANDDNVNEILMMLPVDCSTFDRCVSSLLLETNYDTSNPTINIINEMVKPIQCTIATCQWLTTEINPISIQKELISYILAISQKDDTPLNVVFIADRIIKFLQTQQALPILSEVEQLIPDAQNALPVVLEAIAQNQNIPIRIQSDTRELIKYIKSKEIPHHITKEDVIKLLLLLLDKTDSPKAVNKIKECINDIRKNPKEFDKLFEEFHVNCVTVKGCVASIVENLSSTKAVHHPSQLVLKEFLETLTVPANNIREILDAVVQQVANILQKTDVPFQVKLDLKQLLQILTTEDLSSVLGKILTNNPADALLQLLENFPVEILWKYGVVNNVQNVIEYLKYDKSSAHLEVNTFTNLVNILAQNTTDTIIATNIQTDLQTLEHMPKFSEIVSMLPVSCHSLENCVDSIVVNIQQLPVETATQIINNIMKPPGCTTETCNWIESNGSKNLNEKVKYLRWKLKVIGEASETPLIIKIYARELLRYITPEVISWYLSGNNLDSVLSSMALDSRFETHIRDVAKGMLDFLHENITPSTLTHQDIVELTQILISNTYDSIVRNELGLQTNKILVYCEYVDDLLKKCREKWLTLEATVQQLYDCAVAHPNHPVSNVILQYVRPPHCTVQICAWMPAQEKITQMQNVVQDVESLAVDSHVPFHIQMDLKQLVNVLKNENLKGNDMGLDVLAGESVTVGNVFENLIPKANEALLEIFPDKVTDGTSSIINFLKNLSINVVLKHDLFNNIKNILTFFSEGKLPGYLDVNTLQNLTETLAHTAKAESVSLEILDNWKTLNKLSNIKDLINSLSVKCDSLHNCITSLEEALSQSAVPLPVCEVLQSILNPASCSKETCEWFKTSSDSKTVQIMLDAKQELLRLVHGHDVPLIIKIYSDHILRYITANKFLNYAVSDTSGLKSVLEYFIRENKLTKEIQTEAEGLLEYLQYKTIPNRLTSAEFPGIIYEMIANTEDALVRQHLQTITKHINRHKKDLDEILRNCSIECTSLRPCLDQVRDCAKPSPAVVSQILEAMLHPPFCTIEVCDWMSWKEPSDTDAKLHEKHDSRYVIMFVSNERNELAPVMLDLNDRQLITILMDMSREAPSCFNPIILDGEDKDRNHIHISLDVTNPQLLQILQQHGGRTVPSINFNTMRTVTIFWPSNYGQVIPITFDLSNPIVRKKLLKHTRLKPIRKKPFLIIHDFDGSQSFLCIDNTDSSLVQDMMTTSVNNVRDTKQPILLLWPSESGAWNSINLQELTSGELLTIKHLPQSHVVGTSKDLLVTSKGAVPLSFDIYDSYVSTVLDSMFGHKMTVIDADRNPHCQLVVPDDYGRLTTVNVKLTVGIVDELQRPWPNDGRKKRPTFMVKIEGETIPIYLNPDNPKVYEFIKQLLSLSLSEETVMVTESVDQSMFDNSINQCLTGLSLLKNNNRTPLIVKLSIERLETFFQSQQNMKNVLESSKNSSLDIVSKLQNTFDTLGSVISNLPDSMLLHRNCFVKLLENLPATFVRKAGIRVYVQNVLNYFKQGKVPNKLDENMLAQVLETKAREIENRETATKLKHVAETLHKVPFIKETLGNLPVQCNTLDECIKNLCGIAHILPTHNQVRIVMGIIEKLLTTVRPDTAIITVLTKLLHEVSNAYTSLKGASRLPFHLQMDADQAIAFLENKGVQQRLIQTIVNLPRRESQKIANEATHLLARIENDVTMTPADLIRESLKVLPYKALKHYKIYDNVINIVNYARNGVLPTTLNANTFEQLVKILVEKTKDGQVAMEIRNKAKTLLSRPNVKDLFAELPVECSRFDSCVKSLTKSLQMLPVESEVVQLMKDIFKHGIHSSQSSTVHQLLQTVADKLSTLKDQHNVPFSIQMEIDQLRKTLTNPNNLDRLQDIISTMSPEEVTKLTTTTKRGLEKLKNTSRVNPAQIFEILLNTLPATYLKTVDLSGSRDIVNYFENGEAPKVLNINKLAVLAETISNNVKDETIAFDIKDKFATLEKLTNIEEILNQTPVNCDSFLACIESLADALCVSPYLDESFDTVADSLREAKKVIAAEKKDDTKLTVLPLQHGNDYVILDLNDEDVVKKLADVSDRVNSKYPTIVMDVHVDGKISTIKLNLDDVTTSMALKQIERETLKSFEPVKVENQFGSSVIGAVPDQTGKVTSFVIKDDQDTRNYLQNLKGDSSTAITLPMTGGDVQVYANPKDISATRPDDFIYLPPNSDAQPGCLPLPDSNLLPTDQVLNVEGDYTNGPGTKVPVVRPDGTVGFVVVDLRNETVLQKLKEKSPDMPIETPDDSFMILSVPDRGRTAQHILNMSDERVLQQLSHMTDTVNPKSKKLVTYYHITNEDKATPITLDMDNLNVEHLNELSTKTSPNMKPLDVKDDERHTSATALVLFHEGKVKPIVLDVDDVSVRHELFAISDALNTKVTPFEVTDNKGRSTRLYIDRTNSTVTQKLVELSEKAPVFEKPLVNRRPSRKSRNDKIRIVVKDESGRKLLYNVNGKKKDALNKVKDLSQRRPRDKPTTIFTASDGSTLSISSDSENTGVIRVLDDISDSVNVLSSTDSLLVIKAPNQSPVILDVNDQDVVDALVKLPVKNETSGNVNAFVVTDSKGNSHNIVLDLFDESAVDVLKGLGEKTPQNLTPIHIKDSNKTLTVFDVPKRGGKPETVVLDASNTKVLDQLISISDMFNPNAKRIVVYDDHGNAVPLYLDLSKPIVQKVLHDVSDNTKTLSPPPVRTDATAVSVPIFENGQRIVLKCNLKNQNVVGTLERLSGINGDRPVTYKISIADTYGTYHSVVLDVANPFVKKELKKICSPPAEPKDLMLLTMKDENDETTSLVLNTKDITVQNQLKALSEMVDEDAKNDAAQVQIKDNDGKIVTLYLDLKNPEVVKTLQDLHEQSTLHYPPVTQLVDANGDSSLIAVKTTDEFGNPATHVLDTTDKEVLQMLLENSDEDNPRAVPIEVQTARGKMKVYLDIKDLHIMKMLKLFSKKRQPKEVVNVKPVYNPMVTLVFIDETNHPVEITLNMSKPAVKDLIMASASHPTGNTRVVHVMDDKGVVRPYHVDVTDGRLVKDLKTVCDQYEYTASDGSLALIPVPTKSDAPNYIILDLKNENVLKQLNHVSEVFGNPKNKTSFQYPDADGNVQVCSLDLTDRKTQEELKKLQGETLPWVTPTTVVNPYGPSPYVIMTIADETGKVVPIVLDTNNKELLDELKTLQTPDVIRPLKLKFTDENGNPQTITLDGSRPSVLDRLKDLCREIRVNRNEVIVNQPLTGDVSPELIIPIRNKENQLVYYIFDTSDTNVFKELLDLASPIYVPSSIIYARDPHGEITPIRINTKDANVVDALKHLCKKKRVKVDPKSLVIITVLDRDYSKVPLVLDVFNKEVVAGLKNISDHISPDGTTTAATICEPNGNLVPISFDLENPNVVKQLQALQQKTPKEILPVEVKTPLGTRPCIILTLEDDFHNVVPIVLDTNNQNVVEQLKLLSRPDDKDTYTISVIDRANRHHTIHINPKEPVTKDTLTNLCQLFPFTPVPITNFDKKQPIIIPIVDEEGTPLNIYIEPDDDFAVDTLSHLSHISPPNGASLQLNIPTKKEVLQVKLAKKLPQVIETLKKLGRRCPKRLANVVIPFTGFLPLIPVYIIISNDKVEIVTIDPNIPKVLHLLEQINNPHGRNFDILRLKIPNKYGEFTKVNVPLRDPSIIPVLVEILRLSFLNIHPVEVVLPYKQKPILNLVIPYDRGTKCVTLDLESDEILNGVRPFDSGFDRNTVALEFDTPNAGKTQVNLDLKNPNVVKKLQKLSNNLPVAITPIDQGYPLVVVTLDTGERIPLAIDNPKVVRELVKIAKLPENLDYEPTTFTLIQDGLDVPVEIGCGNPHILDTLRKLAKKARLPVVLVMHPRTIRFLELIPVRVVPPGHSLYPLVPISIGGEMVTVNPNNDMVMSELSFKMNDGGDFTVIKVTDIDGNTVILKIDLNNPNNIRKLKGLAKTCPVQFEPNDRDLPILIVDVVNKMGVIEPIRLDLRDKIVLDTLIKLGRNQYIRPYRIMIPLKRGPVILELDFNDQRVVEKLNTLVSGSSAKPYYVTFDVSDRAGDTWRIVLDLGNKKVLVRLLERAAQSEQTGKVTLEMEMPNGEIKKIKLDLYDPSTIKLLKDLTLQSTGKPAKQVTKNKPKYFFEFTFTNPKGESHTFKLDANNDNVMKKLKQLSNMFSGKTVTNLEMELPSGELLSLKFDVTDDITIENLKNLQRESLTGKSVPLIPLSQKSFEPKLLISFDINSPHYGKVTITLDLYLPNMMDKLRQLSRRFVEGQPETQVPMDDQRGHTFTLRLDLTNPKTVEALARFTEESTGKNPLGKKSAGDAQVYSPDLLTIEVPCGLESVPVTLDQTDPMVVKQLLKLNNQTARQAMVLNIKVNGRPTKVSLETTNKVVLSGLQAVAIPTAFPVVAAKISLITLIFVPTGRGYSPIEIDLSKRDNVRSLVELSVKNQKNLEYASYLEVRDDTGQYIRVPLDLTNRNTLNELQMISPPVNQLTINAQRMPYIVMVLPSNVGPYKVIKFQTKPKILKQLEQKSPPNAKGVTLNIVDALEKKYTFRLDDNMQRLALTVSTLESAVTLGPSYVKNFFIIYRRDGHGEMDPIYLNLKLKRTLIAVKRLKYSFDLPLTVIQYKNSKNEYRYEFIDIVSASSLEHLVEHAYPISGHAITKQTLIHKVLLNVPYGTGGRTLRITLNMADPKVLRELKDISRQYVPGGTTTIIELEDAYGFPLELKIDYTDKNTMARLKALDSPN